MIRSLLVAGLLHLVMATPAIAQFPSALAAGARVRITVPDSVRQEPLRPRQQELIGTVAGVAADTLYLTVPNTTGTLAVPRSVSRGVPSRVTSALRRGVEWAAAGALAAFVAQGYEEDASSRSGSEQVAVGAGIGFGVGAVLGAVWPSERWRRLRLPE